MKKSKYVLLISLDAISNPDVDILLRQPAFASLAAQGKLNREVLSVPVSNTYPNHVSAITGELPCEHGIWSNNFFRTDEKEYWNCYCENIKSPTIFDLVKLSGLKSASIMWPVTGGNRSIDYNLPEIHADKGKFQLTENLKYGSTSYQLEMLARFLPTHMAFNIQTLDSFMTNCACRTIKKYKPNLLCLHLIAADTVKHEHGPSSSQALAEVIAMDKKLAKLIKALEQEGIREETAIVVMGDHGCLPTGRVIDLNAMLRARGVRTQNSKPISKRAPADSKTTSYSSSNPGTDEIGGDWEACYHYMGGTAALLLRDKDDSEIVSRETFFMEAMLRDPASGVKRYMPRDQFEKAGFPKNVLFCVEADKGCEFSAKPHGGHHGFCTDNSPEYTTFYMVSQSGMPPSQETGGCVKDIFGIIKQLLL